MGREQKAESRKKKEETREKLKAPKCTPESPKTSPREPKMAENGARGAPRRPQEGQKSKPEPQDEQQTEPRRSQDRLGSPKADLPTIHALPEADLGGQIGTKTEPKTIPKRSENEEAKKTIQDDLGPVLERSWAISDAILGEKASKTIGKRDVL